jgi:hypothetical protein
MLCSRLLDLKDGPSHVLLQRLHLDGWLTAKGRRRKKMIWMSQRKRSQKGAEERLKGGKRKEDEDHDFQEDEDHDSQEDEDHFKK